MAVKTASLFNASDFALRGKSPEGRMTRLRKAYFVHVEGCEEATVYAPTAASARSIVIADIREAWGCSFKDAMIAVGPVQRRPSADIVLPDRHPLAAMLNPKILHCVVHAWGGRGLHAGYRDYFYTSDADPMLKAAKYHGLFEEYRRDKGRNGRPDYVMYILTDLGKAVAGGEAVTYPRH